MLQEQEITLDEACELVLDENRGSLIASITLLDGKWVFGFMAPNGYIGPTGIRARAVTKHGELTWVYAWDVHKGTHVPIPERYRTDVTPFYDHDLVLGHAQA